MGGSIAGFQLTRHKPGSLTLASRLTPQKRLELLDRLAQTGNVTEAADHVGVSRQSIYDLRANDPAFDAAFSEAMERCTDRLEAAVRKRAERGTSRGVWYKGERVGHEREYHDILSIFMLKAARPDVYRETAGVTVNVGVSAPSVVKLSDAELERVVATQLQREHVIDADTLNRSAPLPGLSTQYIEPTVPQHTTTQGKQRSAVYGKGPKRAKRGGGGLDAPAERGPKHPQRRTKKSDTRKRSQK